MIYIFSDKVYVRFLYFLGPDWEWGNQDGGAGNIGTVLRVDDNGEILVRTLQTFLLYYE